MERSIAGSHLDYMGQMGCLSDKLKDIVALMNTETGENSIEVMTKTREAAEALCRIGDTGTYEDPQAIIDALREEGIDPEKDPIGAWLLAYQSSQNTQKRERSSGGLPAELNRIDGFIKLIEEAKREDVRYEAHARLAKFSERCSNAFLESF